MAAREVLYHTPLRRPLQDILTCIRHGCRLENAGRRLAPNAEHAMLEAAEFCRLFGDDPEAVRRTLEIGERCHFGLGQLRYRYPSEGRSLRELTFQGAKRRYPDGVPQAVVRQLEAELALIDELDYAGYFLTMYEIVEFC